MASNNRQGCNDNNSGQQQQQQLSSQQLSQTEKNITEEEQVKNLVSDLQSQDLFTPPPPVRTTDKGKKQVRTKKQNSSTHGGVPINRKGAKQFIYNPDPKQCSSRDVEMSTVTTTEYNNDPLQQVVVTDEGSKEGDDDDSLSIQSGQTPSVSDKNKLERRNAIGEFMRQFIDNRVRGNSKINKIDKAKQDLHQYYLNQMKLRDRAQRNLDNIRYSKDKYGRVPGGMQIKVKPEVPANEDVVFRHQWAEALGEADKMLSVCIEQHLTKLIEKIDDNICERVNQTLDLIQEQHDSITDPFSIIESTLTEANIERKRINEAIRNKRKRDNQQDQKDDTAPPNKKRNDNQ